MNYLWFTSAKYAGDGTAGYLAVWLAVWGGGGGGIGLKSVCLLRRQRKNVNCIEVDEEVIFPIFLKIFKEKKQHMQRLHPLVLVEARLCEQESPWKQFSAYIFSSLRCPLSATTDNFVHVALIVHGNCFPANQLVYRKRVKRETFRNGQFDAKLAPQFFNAKPIFCVTSPNKPRSTSPQVVSFKFWKGVGYWSFLWYRNITADMRKRGWRNLV
jgi:hypothetical protein